jgi:hypothetical protein
MIRIKRKPFIIPLFKIRRKPHKIPKVSKRALDRKILEQQRLDQIVYVLKSQFTKILEDMIKQQRIIIRSAQMNTLRLQFSLDKFTNKYAKMLYKLHKELGEYQIPLDKFFKFSFLFWSPYEKRANIKEIFDRILKKEIREIAINLVTSEEVVVLDEIFYFLTIYNKTFNPDRAIFLKIEYDIQKLQNIIHHFEMFDKLNLDNLEEYFRIWEKYLDKYFNYVDKNKIGTTYGFILSNKIVPTERQLREFLKTTSLNTRKAEIKTFEDLIQHFGFKNNIRFSTTGYKVNEYKFPRAFTPQHNILDIDVIYPDGSYKTCGKFIKNTKKTFDFFIFEME